MGIYSYTFKSVILESVKIKKSPKVSKWSQKSFLRISENYTFESVILESVKIKRVVVDAHCLYYTLDNSSFLFGIFFLGE